MNTDVKTTIAGVLKLVVAVIGLIGVSISPENQEMIIVAGVVIYSTISAVIAYFTNKPAPEGEVK